jgi:predicted dehydrogenase
MLKFGLLGAGAMGQVHADVISRLEGAQLIAVSGGRLQTAGKLADTHGAQYYEKIKDLINDPKVEVVDICLPAFLHEQCVTLAAAAGKHIFCEKPLALSKVEANRMATAVQSAGVHSMVAQVVRFWPEYSVIKGLLDEGSLGQPLAAYAARLHEPRPVDWLRDPVQGGGAVFDLHIHDLDFFYYLFGSPQSVYALGQQSETGSWDHLFTTLDFGQVKAVAEASYMMPPGHPFSTEFRLVCIEGAVLYRSGFGGRAETPELILYRTGQPPEYLDKPTTDGYLAELEYFVGMLNQGQAPAMATMNEACEVLDIAIAVQQSLVSGNTISL